MNKKQLIAEIAGKANLSLSDAGRALDAFTDSVTAALKAGDSVQLVGFATMAVKERPGRVGINPLNKKPIEIKSKKVVKFKAGKALEEAIQ